MEENEFTEWLVDNMGYGARVIEFSGGPLDGELHEVETGWPCPTAVMHVIPGGGMAVYDVDRKTGMAKFMEIEL